MPVLFGFKQLAALPEERITDKISRRVLSGKQSMMVWWKIKAGAHAAAHKHPHELIVWMLKGRWTSASARSAAAWAPATWR